MLVRQVITAALLAVTAVGAMSQELDRSETLQGRSLAAQQEQAAQSRSRASVAAETRNLQAQGELSAVGDRAEAPAVSTVSAQARPSLGARIKKGLAQSRANHPAHADDFAGPV